MATYEEREPLSAEEAFDRMMEDCHPKKEEVKYEPLSAEQQEEHNAMVKRCKARYRAKYPEKIAAAAKKYYTENKEIIAIVAKKYRDNMETIDCECGSSFKKSGLTRHLKTIKHKDFLKK